MLDRELILRHFIRNIIVTANKWSKQKSLSIAAVPFSSTSTNSAKRIVERIEGDTIVVGLEEEKTPQKRNYFVPDPKVLEENKRKKGPNACQCPLCVIPVPVSYQDVLILEQFMRPDGTVIPRDFTGLCEEQQSRVERCVMQAHWSKLFPDRTIAGFDLSGYKRFRRHWEDDLAMERPFIKIFPGSWYYIKRYNPRKALYSERKRPLYPQTELKIPPLTSKKELQQEQRKSQKSQQIHKEEKGENSTLDDP